MQFDSAKPVATITPPKEAEGKNPAVPPQQQQEPQLRNQADADAESADKAEVTKQASPKIIAKEESVEYRDQHGNILDPEQVASLAKAGSVSFQTKYETRTRLVDAQGREVKQNVAPPHPDVEGQNPETVEKQNQKDSGDKPASVAGDEKSVPRDDGKPKPASEGQEATRNADEL